MEQRYQAFRRFAATSADAGKKLSYPVLVKEFNAQASREAFARTMGPRKAGNLGITKYSFKDLADEARAFMKQANQHTMQSEETVLDQTPVGEDRLACSQGEGLQCGQPEHPISEANKEHLQESQGADRSAHKTCEIESEPFQRKVQEDAPGGAGHQKDLLVRTSSRGASNKNATCDEASAERPPSASHVTNSDGGALRTDNRCNPIDSEKSNVHEIREASIDDRGIDEMVDLTQDDAEKVQMYTIVQETLLDDMDDMFSSPTHALEYDIVADSQSQDESISAENRV